MRVSMTRSARYALLLGEGAMATATQTIRRQRAASAPVHTNVFKEIVAHWSDYLYVLPALIIMGIVILYPLIKVIWLSFHFTSVYHPELGDQFVGLDNYKDAVHDEHFGLVVRNTIVWTFFSTIIRSEERRVGNECKLRWWPR